MLWFLIALATLYTIAYLSHPSTPGRVDAPLGWWDWSDQSAYMKSMRAFARRDLAAANHYYPPGYALIGSLFVHRLPAHPFFVVDAICFLVFAAAFVRVAADHVGTLGAMALFAVSVLAPMTVLLDSFVVPWTTIPVAALLGVLAWMVADGASGPAAAAAFGALMGAIVPIRPGDVLLTVPLAVAFVASWRTSSGSARPGIRIRRMSRDVLILLLFASIGPILFVWLNVRIYGTPNGFYLQLVRSIGWHPTILPEKLVSLFLDSASLHVEPGASILERWPWVFVAAIGIVLTWLNRERALAALGVSIVAQWLAYACYADLLPHGIWRYRNIHYFVWACPYLALFATLAVVDLWRRQRLKRFATVSALVTLAFSGGFVRDEIPASVAMWEDAGGQHAVDMTLADRRTLNVIDLSGWTGTYRDVFTTVTTRLWIDGSELRSTTDFKPLLADFGIRILLIQPRSASHVHIRLSPSVRNTGGTASPSAATYRVRPTIPRWPRRWLGRLAGLIS